MGNASDICRNLSQINDLLHTDLSLGNDAFMLRGMQNCRYPVTLARIERSLTALPGCLQAIEFFHQLHIVDRRVEHKDAHTMCRH